MIKKVKKRIKSYEKYGKECGIAKQVEGQTVEAWQDTTGKWHYFFEGNNWVASDYAFEEEE